MHRKTLTQRNHKRKQEDYSTIPQGKKLKAEKTQDLVDVIRALRNNRENEAITVQKTAGFKPASSYISVSTTKKIDVNATATTINNDFINHQISVTETRATITALSLEIDELENNDLPKSTNILLLTFKELHDLCHKYAAKTAQHNMKTQDIRSIDSFLKNHIKHILLNLNNDESVKYVVAFGQLTWPEAKSSLEASDIKCDIPVTCYSTYRHGDYLSLVDLFNICLSDTLDINLSQRSLGRSVGLSEAHSLYQFLKFRRLDLKHFMDQIAVLKKSRNFANELNDTQKHQEVENLISEFSTVLAKYPKKDETSHGIDINLCQTNAGALEEIHKRAIILFNQLNRLMTDALIPVKTSTKASNQNQNAALKDVPVKTSGFKRSSLFKPKPENKESTAKIIHQSSLQND